MAATLDPRYLPYINNSSQNVDPNATRLSLMMEPYEADEGAQLCITMPYRINFTILRPRDDSHRKPVTYRWSAWESMAKGRFRLLHELASGELEPIEVSKLGGLVDSMYEEEEEETSVTESAVEEAGPGDHPRRLCTLTANYQTKMTPGEKYHLIWPGGEIDLWQWGSKEQLWDTTLKPRRGKGLVENSTALVLTPAGGVIFKAYDADTPFPDRQLYIEEDGPHASYDTANEIEQDWRYQQHEDAVHTIENPEPISTAERISGAPILRYTIVRAGPFHTVSKLTYEALSGDRAITFHKWPIRRQCCVLYRWQDDGWNIVPDDPNIIAYYPWLSNDDDENVDIRVGESENNFMSLQPGESWVKETSYQPWHEVARRGDKFKFIWPGAVFDWWDWGTMQDHMETAVVLPPWEYGKVQDPADNNGRPRLVVPTSNEIEFVWEA